MKPSGAWNPVWGQQVPGPDSHKTTSSGSIGDKGRGSKTGVKLDREPCPVTPPNDQGIAKLTAVNYHICWKAAVCPINIPPFLWFSSYELKYLRCLLSIAGFYLVNGILQFFNGFHSHAYRKRSWRYSYSVRGNWTVSPPHTTFVTNFILGLEQNLTTWVTGETCLPFYTLKRLQTARI